MTIERLSNYRVICIRLKNPYLSYSERERLEAEKQIIDDFVKNISDKDAIIKQIIEWRYIDGTNKISWQTIAMRLGYLADHTPKRKLDEYLKNNRKL